MARITEFSEAEQRRLNELDCPAFDSAPWVRGGPLAERRVAMISSAGLMMRGDKPVLGNEPGFRAIANDANAADVLLSHVSVNFDRTGFQADMNVVFPRDRLNELAAEEVIGSAAAQHYSFMGAPDPRELEGDARKLASALKADHVDTVALFPV